MKITQVLVLLAVGGLGVATTFAAARGGGRAGNPPAGPNTTVSSLTRPATPTATPDEKGFLRRWLVLEPIRGSGLVTDSGVQAAAKKEYFPNQMTVVPHDGDKVAVDGAERRRRLPCDDSRATGSVVSSSGRIPWPPGAAPPATTP